LNQLKKVVDLSNSPQGFKDDSDGDSNTDLQDDYNYDQYGNMTKDQNKHITLIKYNHLNLPVEINFTNNRKISYTYDATGVKLKKDVFYGNHTITNYVNGYQYKNNKLQFFPTSEGYIKPVYNERSTSGAAVFSYVYNYTDHLGNTRVSYTKFNDHVKVLEETNYYPFGLKHGNYNTAKKEITLKQITNEKQLVPTNVNGYKYKYNGKELQNEFNLSLYDLGARGHDPARVQFGGIDPRAEEYYSQSPYVFASNNPVFYVDINGEGVDWIPKINKDGSTSYIAEDGDNAKTLASQFGLKQNVANKIYTNATDNTNITGQEVMNVTGSEVLKLNMSSDRYTNQRFLDQYMFARAHTTTQPSTDFELMSEDQFWKVSNYFTNTGVSKDELGVGQKISGFGFLRAETGNINTYFKVYMWQTINRGGQIKSPIYRTMLSRQNINIPVGGRHFPNSMKSTFIFNSHNTINSIDGTIFSRFQVESKNYTNTRLFIDKKYPKQF